jgi:hypothetical protein
LASLDNALSLPFGEGVGNHKVVSEVLYCCVCNANMVDDTAASKSKLEELIEKKRQEQDDERERQRRQREESIADIDFGDGSDEDNLDPRPEAQGMFDLFKTLFDRESE